MAQEPQVMGQDVPVTLDLPSVTYLQVRGMGTLRTSILLWLGSGMKEQD